MENEKRLCLRADFILCYPFFIGPINPRLSMGPITPTLQDKRTNCDCITKW